MAMIARILGLSLLTAGIGVALGCAFGKFSDAGILYVLFGCVGALIGAVAGAAKEVVMAMRKERC